MLNELKTLVEDVASRLETLRGKVDTAVEAAGQPTVDEAIVAALVAALEAQGYTVTPPTPEAPAEPQA